MCEQRAQREEAELEDGEYKAEVLVEPEEDDNAKDCAYTRIVRNPDNHIRLVHRGTTNEKRVFDLMSIDIWVCLSFIPYGQCVVFLLPREERVSRRAVIG